MENHLPFSVLSTGRSTGARNSIPCSGLRLKYFKKSQRAVAKKAFDSSTPSVLLSLYASIVLSIRELALLSTFPVRTNYVAVGEDGDFAG